MLGCLTCIRRGDADIQAIDKVQRDSCMAQTRNGHNCAAGVSIRTEPLSSEVKIERFWQIDASRRTEAIGGVAIRVAPMLLIKKIQFLEFRLRDDHEKA